LNFPSARPLSLFRSLSPLFFFQKRHTPRARERDPSSPQLPPLFYSSQFPPPCNKFFSRVLVLLSISSIYYSPGRQASGRPTFPPPSYFFIFPISFPETGVPGFFLDKARRTTPPPFPQTVKASVLFTFAFYVKSLTLMCSGFRLSWPPLSTPLLPRYSWSFLTVPLSRIFSGFVSR